MDANEREYKNQNLILFLFALIRADSRAESLFPSPPANPVKKEI
jgi:hypothetical protein